MARGPQLITIFQLTEPEADRGERLFTLYHRRPRQRGNYQQWDGRANRLRTQKAFGQALDRHDLHATLGYHNF